MELIDLDNLASPNTPEVLESIGPQLSLVPPATDKIQLVPPPPPNEPDATQV